MRHLLALHDAMLLREEPPAAAAGGVPRTRPESKGVVSVKGVLKNKLEGCALYLPTLRRTRLYKREVPAQDFTHLDQITWGMRAPDRSRGMFPHDVGVREGRRIRNMIGMGADHVNKAGANGIEEGNEGILLDSNERDFIPVPSR